MVTLSRERPSVPQINRSGCAFGLRGVFQPHCGDLFYSVSRAEMGCFGHTDPGAPRTWTGKQLDVALRDSSTELQLMCPLLLLALMPLLLLLTGVVSLCLSPPFPPFLPPSISISSLQGIKKPHELMKMSEVIKHGGDGDTDPGRVSEGQEGHMGPRPAWSDITLLPSYVPYVPRLHGTQIWLDWPAGHREEARGWVKLAPKRVGGRSRMKVGGVDWAQASPVARCPSLDPSPGSQVTLRGPNTSCQGRRGRKQQHGG